MALVEYRCKADDAWAIDTPNKPARSCRFTSPFHHAHASMKRKRSIAARFRSLDLFPGTPMELFRRETTPP